VKALVASLAMALCMHASAQTIQCVGVTSPSGSGQYWIGSAADSTTNGNIYFAPLGSSAPAVGAPVDVSATTPWETGAAYSCGGVVQILSDSQNLFVLQNANGRIRVTQIAIAGTSPSSKPGSLYSAVFAFTDQYRQEDSIEPVKMALLKDASSATTDVVVAGNTQDSHGMQQVLAVDFPLLIQGAVSQWLIWGNDPGPSHHGVRASDIVTNSDGSCYNILGTACVFEHGAYQNAFWSWRGPGTLGQVVAPARK